MIPRCSNVLLFCVLSVGANYSESIKNIFGILNMHNSSTESNRTLLYLLLEMVEYSHALRKVASTLKECLEVYAPFLL